MRTDNPLDVSVVVPVYGAVDALAELASRLDTALAAAGLSYELIFVDDRGDPRAWSHISQLSAQQTRIRGIRLTRNFGQHAATICGMLAATGRCVITMDEDLEHPPEAVPDLVAACDDNHPLVYGVFPRRTHRGWRNLSSEAMRRTLKLAFPDLNESYTSFRAVRSDLAHRLASFELNRPYIDGMLSWLTRSVATVDVAHGARVHGQSTYTPRKLIAHAVNIFITFSPLPLRMAAYCGAAIAFLSFVYLVYIVAAYLTGHVDNPGYASLMTVILFSCGVQLIMLGVAGEYIGRLMSAANRRPVFAIDVETPHEPFPQHAGADR